MRLARRLLQIVIVKPKLDEMTREAREGAERARALRGRLQEATATVDGLVDEARSTLKRAVAFLEREGLRGKKSGLFHRVESGGQAAPAESNGKNRDDAPESESSSG